MGEYFNALIAKLETSEVTNAGKDKDGFFLPTRHLLLRHLTLLKDLWSKPAARAMVKDSWRFVAENAPTEWLVMTDEQKKSWKAILS